MSETIYFKGNVQTEEPVDFLRELKELCAKHDTKYELEVAE